MKFQGRVKNGFYESVRLMLLVARCVGLLPISGLTQGNSELTRHTFKSPYSLIYLISIGAQVCWVILHVYDNIVSPFEIRRFGRLFFGMIGLTSELLVVRFSRKWNKMLKKIESIESSLPPVKNSRYLVKSTNRLMAIVFTAALVDHGIFMVYSINMSIHCPLGLQPDAPDLYSYVRSYFNSVYPWFYKYFPYSIYSATLLKISGLQLAFMWTFMDVIIMVSSLYLVLRFQDFNRLMAKNQQEIKNGVNRLPWQDLQVYYTKLTRLVKIVNKNISALVFLSLSSNLSFIGQQMFFIINKLFRHNFVKFSNCFADHSNDWYALIYLIESMAFLFGRTFLVAFIGAHLHTLSREPLNALHTVPASAYNDDLQRFMDQVHYSNIGLSGFGFFYVTRGMILSVVATLMTYELVLLQF